MTILFKLTDGTQEMRDEFMARFPQAKETRYRDLSESGIDIAEGNIMSQTELFDAMDNEARRGGWIPAVKLESPTSEAYWLAELISRNREERFWQHCQKYAPGVIGDAKSPWSKTVTLCQE